MITALISHPAFHHHNDQHPENPLRLKALETRLAARGLNRQLHQFDARPATDEQLLAVHAEHYLARLQRLANRADAEHRALEAAPDTPIDAARLTAARLAAGGVARAVDLVMREQCDNAFCAIRPPGHHAERDSAMGFCLYNNVAVGIAQARLRYGVERIALIDFDLHQCNGSIDIFADDPGVLICSSFQRDLFPWRYQREAPANVVNAALAPGEGAERLRELIDHDWLPRLEAHRPQLVFLSAGFDAHREDPLGELCFEDADFVELTHFALGVAERHAQRRLVSVLEGGYAPKTLSRCVALHLDALAGLGVRETPSELPG
ncbi:histone deacetylase family protein [Halotalea alkalilenta]|uniref:Deacetylase n=1 Tax=Halotalea alkalilenta TaxID=376489 RepID=A0A172YG03_9GAMM|nr:histone deacetylase family protein [Halotalea alkalilenta]ANF58127.1 deacetylase [Halotalea alkalilenta]